MNFFNSSIKSESILGALKSEEYTLIVDFRAFEVTLCNDML